jgi:hypothetical protein
MSATTKASITKPPRFPIQFRLPPAGEVDPWFQFNRSAWNTLILPGVFNEFRPPVKSITSRMPGKRRGIRIIIFSSAKGYFDRLRAEQLQQPAKIAS